MYVGMLRHVVTLTFEPRPSRFIVYGCHVVKLYNLPNSSEIELAAELLRFEDYQLFWI